MKFYMVGGCVRDSLLGVKSKDIDYSVEASSYEEMRNYIQSRGKIFLESAQHLTIRAHMADKEPADFVLCRKDGAYSDGRRPDSVTPGTLYDDLARRDFTVNAIAFNDETKEYIDPHGGIVDLQNKLLRCVGKAEDRFREDALRMLRAIRFSITKGLRMDPELCEALIKRELIDLLDTKISVDRKRDELQKCFQFDTCKTIETLMYIGMETKFLEHIFNGKSGKIWLLPTNKES